MVPILLYALSHATMETQDCNLILYKNLFHKVQRVNCMLYLDLTCLLLYTNLLTCLYTNPDISYSYLLFIVLTPHIVIHTTVIFSEKST